MRRWAAIIAFGAGLALGAGPARSADPAAMIEVLIKALEALSVDTGRLQQSMVETQDRVAALERKVKELEMANRRP